MLWSSHLKHWGQACCCFEGWSLCELLHVHDSIWNKIWLTASMATYIFYTEQRNKKKKSQFIVCHKFIKKKCCFFFFLRAGSFPSGCSVPAVCAAVKYCFPKLRPVGKSVVASNWFRPASPITLHCSQTASDLQKACSLSPFTLSSPLSPTRTNMHQNPTKSYCWFHLYSCLSLYIIFYYNPHELYNFSPFIYLSYVHINLFRPGDRGH